MFLSFIFFFQNSSKFMMIKYIVIHFTLIKKKKAKSTNLLLQVIKNINEIIQTSNLNKHYPMRGYKKQYKRIPFFSKE